VTKINEPGPGRWVDLEPKALGSFSLKTDPWVRVENSSISLNSGFLEPVRNNGTKSPDKPGPAIALVAQHAGLLSLAM
jgi:hypothetical protein